MARIVKIRANPTPDPPDLGSGPDPGGRVGSGVRGRTWRLGGLGGSGPGSGGPDPEVWGPGRVARTVPEGQAPGGKITKIAKIAIFRFCIGNFPIKTGFFRKTRVLAGFFHFSGHPDRKNGVRTPDLGLNPGPGPGFGPKSGPRPHFRGVWTRIWPNLGGLGGLAVRSRVRGRTRRARRVGPATRTWRS